MPKIPNAPPKLLIVEDEPASLEMLSRYFERNHYQVEIAVRGDQVEEILSKAPADVVLLDINLPGKSGLSVLRDIRGQYSGGIIFVTQAAEDVDKIVGLELGADDYVTKPYNLRELGARVRNLLERLAPRKHEPRRCEVTHNAVRFGDWTLDQQRQLLISSDNQKSPLTEAEYRVLSVLMENAGAVSSRDYIMQAMKRREWSYSDRSIDVLIGRVRKKLRDNVEMPNFIRTVHGTGYMFIAELEKCSVSYRKAREKGEPRL